MGAIEAHANPVSPDLYGFSSSTTPTLFITFSCLFLEYLVVRWLIRKWVKFRHAFPAFVLINVFSFPLTIVLGFIFSLFAESFPLAIEPPLYRWFFRKFGIEVPGLTSRIVCANLVSFIAGGACYYAITQIK